MNISEKEAHRLSFRNTYLYQNGICAD